MIRIIKHLFTKYLYERKWRKQNRHNQVKLIKMIPFEKVSIGKMSYGNIDVRYFGNDSEKLIIGDFVSISDGVIFILGGNHQINTITNYPLYSKFIELNPNLDARSSGPIIIEDEVWIGTGAIILSGVKVSKGAIIAAGSVVTKDIPPYSIFGGNPAKLIRKRFDNEIIKELENIQLSEIDKNKIINNIHEFYKPINFETINIIKRIKNDG